MTKTAPVTWTEARWPAKVIALELLDAPQEIAVVLQVGVGRIQLALPADHTPPAIGEQLLVTLQRGAQP